MTGRRAFIGGLSALAAGCCLPPARRRLRIESADASFVPEPILRPFGFKGGYLSELWQTRVRLASTSHEGVGLGVQSCLWSDAGVFSAFAEKEANGFMFAMTKRAAEISEGMEFETPPELLNAVFPEVLSYGRRLTGRAGLRPTFALNALVPLDFAAWRLYASENGMRNYDQMLPEKFRAAQSARHSRCAAIPLVTYGSSVKDVENLVKDGYFFLKIKIGHPGTQDEMLAKDCARISAIHAVLKDMKTPWTENGRPAYYFDANGRYERKETFLRFVDHLAKIGAAELTMIIEEPFDEQNEIDVSDIPARLAADEAAHTVDDAEKRMDMGYRAMALKPIAKTLSVSLAIAAAAKRRNIPCFCADLTVNPVMVEWNKAVAARLDVFPGLKGLGLVESNGEQNYVNWERMRRALPYPDAPWTRTKNGLFELDADYWNKSGGVLQ